MLTKRIIPCLDIKDGRTVKGVNFMGLRDAGDPVALAKRYSETGADELVFLDISATEEGRKTLSKMGLAVVVFGSASASGLALLLKIPPFFDFSKDLSRFVFVTCRSICFVCALKFS